MRNCCCHLLLHFGDLLLQSKVFLLHLKLLLHLELLLDCNYQRHWLLSSKAVFNNHELSTDGQRVSAVMIVKMM